MKILSLFKRKISRAEFTTWVDKRIAETQEEYLKVQSDSHRTEVDYNSNAKQNLISKGGKLRAYKEVREYLNSH